ncbi:hypothetical protein L345_14035 [Ophiophagus hannah]|uniref:Uncharacterized protein n=1 Tax=Ophiophagus hannah TaxID=8665 RepID=V8NF07_OPHHA|nr:hypothetical protein L345_14035 [Ophiophagus hannah]
MLCCWTLENVFGNAPDISAIQ